MGLTLIELMVALAVVAVLGVISYRAVAAAADSRQRLSTEYRRWGDITRCVQMLENDLLQVVVRPQVMGMPGDGLELVQSNGSGVELRFLKLDGARAGARRIGYRFESGRILLLRWPGTDAQSPPRQDAVLADVIGLRFSFFNAGSQQWTGAWPTTPAAANVLPAAVSFDLDLADAGTIHRVIALR